MGGCLLVLHKKFSGFEKLKWQNRKYKRMYSGRAKGSRGNNATLDCVAFNCVCLDLVCFFFQYLQLLQVSDILSDIILIIFLGLGCSCGGI